MEGNRASKGIYSFGDFQIDPRAKILRSGSNEIHLAPRPFEVLCFLLANNDRVVKRTELLDKFWNGHDVYDDALRKCVGAIRKALDDSNKPARFIETRYGGGYRFVADVESGATDGNGHHGNLDASSLNRSDNSATERYRSDRSNRRLFSRISARVLLFVIVGFYVFGPRKSASTDQTVVAAAAPAIHSIAIMPIKNLTRDVTNEYFSDGITESLITELALSDDVRVISRSSTFAFKDKETDPRTLGQILNVDSLLEGSVQKRGENVTVRVRLVNTVDGSIIWTSNDFERPLTEAFDLQDVIACNLAAELRTEICKDIPNKRTKNGLAYQEYLKGRFEWNKRTAAGIKKSIEHYRTAIEMDPSYALAYSGLSESYVQGIWHVPFDAAEVLPKAKETALRAVELDDDLTEAHTALAEVYSLEWKWDASRRELRRAIELDPRNARAHHVLAFWYMIQGRNDEAVASINAAADLDPLNLVIGTDKATILLQAGRTDDALRQWENLLFTDPNFAMARENRFIAFELAGDDAATTEEYAAILKLRGETPAKVAAMRHTAKEGFKAVRRSEYNELLTKLRRGEQVSPVVLAIYCALLGRSDDTFMWLEKAYREHSALIVLVVSPQFSSVRDDPRFRDLLQRLNLSLDHSNHASLNADEIDVG